jgi:hypothetical protein
MRGERRNSRIGAAGTGGGVSALPRRSFFFLEEPMPSCESVARMEPFLLLARVPADVEASADEALASVATGAAGGGA